MSNTKLELEDYFRDLKALGVYFADKSDWETGHVVMQDDVDPTEWDKYNFEAFLPNDNEMSICSWCVHWIRDLFGDRADMYGFDVDKNPRCKSQAVRSCSGHDFAVIDDRYIVDLWVSKHAKETEQYVFDIQSKEDSEKIVHFFGHPKRWEYFDFARDNYIKPRDPSYPAAKRVLRLGEPRTDESELSCEL